MTSVTIATEYLLIALLVVLLAGLLIYTIIISNTIQRLKLLVGIQVILFASAVGFGALTWTSDQRLQASVAKKEERYEQKLVKKESIIDDYKRQLKEMEETLDVCETELSMVELQLGDESEDL